MWYGARFLLKGRNPYFLVGPGGIVATPTPLLYPAPSFVAVLPLTLIPFHLSGAVFVFLSTVLLAWGATFDGWHRLPMFASIAFLTTAQMGQWSILMTAMVFIPALGFLAVVKPQASLPIIGSLPTGKATMAALLGGLVLIGTSFVLLPDWPVEWWHLVTSSPYFAAPIAQAGGFVVSLVLIRWRRSDAWLVFLAACLPQTWHPYNGLLLLAVAATYREACVLSIFSSLGWIMVSLFAPGVARSPETRHTWGMILLATSYLPAAIVVLRRPNTGPSPWWLRFRAASNS